MSTSYQNDENNATNNNDEIFFNEEKPSHHYRIEIPNIIDDMDLDPYTYRVYCKIKRIAGDGGKCWQARAKIAISCNISESKLKECLIKLEKGDNKFNLPLIRRQERKKEDGDNETSIITILDIWNVNGKFYKEGGGRIKTPGGSPQNPGGFYYAPKEEPIKKNHKKEGIHIAISEAKPPEITDKISFSWKNHQFEKISQDIIESWKKSFPSVDIIQQINQSQEYIKSRPTTYKRRKNWNKFLVDWFSRNQEKANSPASYPKKKSSYASYSRQSELDKMAEEILERNKE